MTQASPNISAGAPESTLSDILETILQGSEKQGRYLDESGTECSADDPGAAWEPYSEEEQAQWLASVAEMARTGIKQDAAQQATIATLYDALQTCNAALDRLANGEAFDVVVEQTGCTHAVTTALNEAADSATMSALDICDKLGLDIDRGTGSVHEAAFGALRDRYGEDWATAVAQGECYAGLLDYAQLHMEVELEPEGMRL